MDGNSEITVGNGNLKPWKPGQSGNPNGRPKGSKNSYTVQLARLMEKTPNAAIQKIMKEYGIEIEGAINADALAHVTLNNALQGDPQAEKAIREAEKAQREDEGFGGGKGTTIINWIGVAGEKPPPITLNGKLIDSGQSDRHQDT